MSYRIDQFVAAVAPGDAITNQALTWRELLARNGIGGEVFAQHVHPALAEVVHPLGMAPRDGSPILLRYSLWSDAAGLALRGTAPMGLVYHNITPSHLVQPLDPVVARLCREGRRELPAFRRRASVTIADSAYNARELIDAGWDAVDVIPLLLDLPMPPPARASVPPMLLFVGRIVPSKCVDDAIRVLAHVRRHHVPDAELTVIGAFSDVGTYRADLLKLVSDLDLDGVVHFRGRVSDAERDSAYASSGVFVTMSEHEGFCAPLLEAMSRGLSVVARASGAVPDTAGAAALLIPGRDIPLAAEAVAEVLVNADTRRGLRTNAVRRIAEVGPTAIEPRILAVLDPLLQR